MNKKDSTIIIIGKVIFGAVFLSIGILGLSQGVMTAIQYAGLSSAHAALEKNGGELVADAQKRYEKRREQNNKTGKYEKTIDWLGRIEENLPAVLKTYDDNQRVRYEIRYSAKILEKLKARNEALVPVGPEDIAEAVSRYYSYSGTNWPYAIYDNFDGDNIRDVILLAVTDKKLEVIALRNTEFSYEVIPVGSFDIGSATDEENKITAALYDVHINECSNSKDDNSKGEDNVDCGRQYKLQFSKWMQFYFMWSDGKFKTSYKRM